jgi:hypothetical protein
VSGVALDLHAAATAVSLLATPEFTVEEGLIDFQSSGHAGKEGDQSFAVGFSRSEVAEHKRSIVPDTSWDQVAEAVMRARAVQKKYAMAGF